MKNDIVEGGREEGRKEESGEREEGEGKEDIYRGRKSNGEQKCVEGNRET